VPSEAVAHLVRCFARFVLLLRTGPQEKVKCSVCKRNDKDVVIARCFHCFCESCIKARLDTRQRKCPTCGETFGKDDVQKIYLNA